MTVSRSSPRTSPKVPFSLHPISPDNLLTPTPAADQLIASLKAELAAQKEEAKEAARLKKQLEASEAKLDEVQTRVTSLTTSLSESRTEIKALNMKLTAARSAEASAIAKAVPGSAMKGGGGSAALLKANSASTQQATQLAQMKEDLYSDLTGLIVRSVKRDGGEDVYDCLQTGRNGSMSPAKEEKNPQPPPGALLTDFFG